MEEMTEKELITVLIDKYTDCLLYTSDAADD